MKLRVIAAVVRGEVDGDAEFEVTALRSLANARGDSLGFCATAEHSKLLPDCAAGAVLLSPQYAKLFPRHKIVVEDAYPAYARASHLFAPKYATNEKIHPTAVISSAAKIHPSVIIGAHCVIGDACEIGEGTIIDAGVTIYARTIVGENCRLKSGAVIGGRGFGYAEENGKWLRIEQLGGVRIGDDVDIGANTTIDRGALDDTVIGCGVKMDNQIQIAHNVRIGAHTIMAGCAAVAGSAVIGARCQLGGRVSVLGHLSIADDTVILANSLVAKSIPQAGTYSATLPARPAVKWRKILARMHRLAK